jgi:hypothetical protein
MGLDIVYYKNAKLAKEGQGVDSDGFQLDGFVTPWDNPSFPGRSEGVECGKTYVASEGQHFGAGSYGGYNNWREELARVAGYPLIDRERYGENLPSCAASAWQATEGPFWELINFSDCEGTIGPVVSAKLAQDFANWQQDADGSPQPGFQRTYANFRKAFEQASDNGFVRFI